MSESRRRIGLEIRRLDHMLSRNLAANVKASGLDEMTLMHGWIIRYLYENRDEEIFQKDIEKNFSVGRSTVTNIIRLMEKRGYLCREAVEKDARLKKVLLTEKGIQDYESVEALIDRMNERIMAGISDEELRVFDRVVAQLKENIRQQHKEYAAERKDIDD